MISNKIECLKPYFIGPEKLRKYIFVLGGTYILSNKIKERLISRKEFCLIVTLSILLAYSFIMSITLETKDSFYAVAPWSIPTIILVATIGIFYPCEKIFNSSVFVFVGNISFELFLIHQLVIRYVETVNNKLSLCINDFTLYGTAVIISIGVAYIANRYIMR